MAWIQLRDYYPCNQKDQFVEVSDEVAAELRQWERDERTYERKRRRYRACYSLDENDGMEQRALFVSVSPDEYYERKFTRQQLCATLAMLPHKQSERIYAYCVEGLSKAEIARKEGVSKVSVNDSIVRGLNRHEKMLKNFR